MGRNLEVLASNRLTARSGNLFLEKKIIFFKNLEKQFYILISGKTEKIISISPGASSGPNSTFVKNKDGTVTYS